MRKALAATVGGLLWLAFSMLASATTPTVESQDLNVHYGGSFFSELAPEPVVFLMVGCGLVLMGKIGRRRRSNQE